VNNALVPRSQAGGNFGFLFSFSGQDWVDSLPMLLLGRSPFHIFRRTFYFDAERFAAAERDLPALPEGFEVREIDDNLLAAQPDLMQDILGTWPSVYTFFKHGCGAAVMHGSELASYCLSPFASGAMMEISVATAEPFKRRGLGRRAAAAFVRRCLNLGKQPNWECFWDNEASTRLAQSLGYTVRKDYPIFYWEERPEKKVNLENG
jgi:RimJ/RimL family protein N-acetyltransferase